MSLRFILGRPGTGKTALCLNEIAGLLRLETAEAYYLVPEQFSLQSERGLAAIVPAFSKAQVLSFNRLAYRLFADLGGPPGKLVDELGRNMLLRRVLYDCAGELTYYARSADKQGFIESLAETIKEFNHYNITVEMLENAAGEESALSPKLRDLALIFKRYRGAVKDRYLLADDALSLLAEKLDENRVGGLFWVDGFNGFTPQERGVLARIMKSAERVTVALTTDGEKESNPLFETTRETKRVLEGLARSLKVEIEPAVYLTENGRYPASGALSFFASRYTLSGPAARFNGERAPIQIISAPDRYAETHEAARVILEITQTGRSRFRDIALLCPNKTEYAPILRNIFGRLNIPLFIDAKESILSHPLTELLRAALDIPARGWHYESVFRFLKTRLTPLTPDEADILENYVMAYGVKGYYWQYPFKTETAEAARVKLLDALSPFSDGLRADKKASVKSFSKRVFGLLYKFDIPGALNRLYAERAEAGEYGAARAHRQIWPKLCEIFDKLVEILGEDRVTLREYARILDAGLSRADLGLIPPTVDEVLLGDAGRSRFPEIKTMIVLGANEGKLPPVSDAGGLFSDGERETLRASRLELAPGLARKSDESAFGLYTALCQPREALILIYPDTESSGKRGAKRPARIISRLKDMFPAIIETRARAFTEYEPPEDAAGFCQPSPGPPPGLRPLFLSKETADRLYGQTVITAASRMERFAGCPFAYFMSYNLKARERKVYEVHPADLGVVFHEVLAAFTRQMAESGQSWDELDKPAIARMVESYVETAVPEDEPHVLRSSARNLYALKKIKRSCATSIWALAEHIRRGRFTPAGIELSFGPLPSRGPQSSYAPETPFASLEIPLNESRKLILTGRIDRVDVFRAADGTPYIKIIDYKSGRKRFSLQEALLGTQLQLLLYMNALLKNGQSLFGHNGAREAKPGGVFYFHIDDPVLSTDSALNPEELEHLLLKQFRMSGLALADTNAIDGMDTGLIENGGESLIIPVGINKNGAFSRQSSIADMETYALINQTVADKVKQIGIKMTEGCISPQPCDEGICGYCGFGNVCRGTSPF